MAALLQLLVALACALPIAEAVAVGHVDISLLVRGQDTARDRRLLGELTASVAEAGWPLSTVVTMVDAARDPKHGGLWTYKPWIFQHEEQPARVRRRIAGGQRWLVFLEPTTAVNMTALAQALSNYNAKKQWFVGHALRDETSSIIHHYSTSTDSP